MSVGEVGEDHHPLEIMGQYTSGGRLHMAYSFGMMGFDFTPAHFRAHIGAFFATAPDGWPTWAFSNHDVIRHMTRWGGHGAGHVALARLCAALLLSFEGSVCLYQGEEFGQTQTELAHDELIDPQGLSFWPEEKGRDGNRTPMVREGGAAQGGFTTGRPWLPVKDDQRLHAADSASGRQVAAFYQAMLALRRAEADLRTGRTAFLDMPAPVLAFRRGAGILCAFTLSPEAVAVDLPPLAAVLAGQDHAAGRLGPNGFVIGRIAASPCSGRMSGMRRAGLRHPPPPAHLSEAT